MIWGYHHFRKPPYVSFLEGNALHSNLQYLNNKKDIRPAFLALATANNSRTKSLTGQASAFFPTARAWIPQWWVGVFWPRAEKGKPKITGLQNAQRSWEFRNVGQIEHFLGYSNYEVSGRTKISLQKGDACSWHIPWLSDYRRLMSVHVANATTKKHQKPIQFIPVPVFSFEKLLWLVNLDGCKYQPYYIRVSYHWFPLMRPYYIHPRNLTWNLKMMVPKRNLLFQGLIFRFYVKLQGCKLLFRLIGGVG